MRPDSQGHESGDKIRRRQKGDLTARRRYYTADETLAKENNSPRNEANLPALVYSWEALIRPGKGLRFWWRLRRLVLSVRQCLSTALPVLHRSFHGDCTGTDYRGLEGASEGESRGVDGGADGSRFVVRRWAAEWAASKSLIMHTPTIAAHYPPIYSLYLFTLAFSRFLSLSPLLLAPLLHAK